MTFTSIKSSGRNAFRIAMSAMLALTLVSCGGGGGEPGTGTAAGRFSLNIVTDTASVFFSGNNATATISLRNNCTGPTSSTTCASTSGVSGQVVTLSSDVSSSLTFSPSIAVTDKDGNAQVAISAATRDVSGIVSVTATSSLSGVVYSGSMAMKVNTQVDRTIGPSDDGFIMTLNATSDCKWFSYIVNVQNPAGVVQDNSVITATLATNAEIGLKDLGLFKNLGQVWFLQVRPNSVTCLVGGATPVIGQVGFSASPGDGSAPYSIGYNIKYQTK